jgi:Secretion system C-terminal sorting domain/Pregnancy-associated plasma protein-A
VSIVDYTQHSERFYIRTYIHFLTTAQSGNWISPADALTQSNAMLNLANAEYNKHGIYLVDGSNLSCSFSTHSFVENNGSIVDLNFYQTYINNFSGSKGLHIFVNSNTEKLPNGKLGWSFSVPSNVLLLSGEESGVPIALTPVLIHEIGHCLGLIHLNQTYKGGMDCPDDVVCPVALPSPKCCNDLVEDTPTIGGLIMCGVDPFAENYMAESIGWICRTSFTAGQVLRMREYLKSYTLNPELQQIQVLPSSSAATVSGDIIVEAGTELVINSTIEMLPDATIRVKRGNGIVPAGILRINATITGACDKMWGGIIMEGTTLTSQSPLYQSQVFLNLNGKIEHAKVGIDVQDPAVSGSGGGILTTFPGSRLENNTIGIRFGNYSDKNTVNGQAVILPNKSSILSTLFTINSSYRGSASVSPAHIVVDKINGLSIRFGRFWEERPICSPRAIGINSTDAGIRVAFSIFRDLEKGIVTDKLTQESGAIDVQHSQFYRCISSIETDMATAALVIRNNHFEMNTTTDCDMSHLTLTGVTVSGNTTSMSLRDNTFQNGEPLIFPVAQNIIGINCKGLGTANNTIIKNQYHALPIGNKAQGNCGNLQNGLVYLCNTHTNANDNTIDKENYQILGSIRLNQGQDIDPSNGVYGPTGNQFSFADFRVRNLASTLNYYYFDDVDDLQVPTSPDPSTSVGINPIERFAENETCTGAINPCEPPCNETNLNTIKTSFYIQKNDYLQKTAQLSGISSSVQQQQLRKEIAGHRYLMDQEAGKILGYYSRDTAVLHVDSLIRWYYIAETQETWQSLAKHYFFTGDSTHFDALWADIPSHFAMNTAENAVYNRLTYFYNLMRPQVFGGKRINQMDSGKLSALESMIVDCDEASFLAKSILRRNGIYTSVECAPISTERNRSIESKVLENRHLRIIPNPASEKVSISFPDMATYGNIQIMDALGRVVVSLHFDQPTRQVSVDISNLISGHYFVTASTATGVLSGTMVVVHQ